MIKYNIKIYNTYFTLQSYVGENALSNVKEKLTTYTWVYNRVYRRKVKNKDKEFFSYNIRCTLFRNGQPVAQGVGSCNSKDFFCTRGFTKRFVCS